MDRTSTVAPRPEPWVPRILRVVPYDVIERLSYVVLDDVDGGDAVVVTAPWPRVDALGRVRYSLDERGEVTIPVDEWDALVGARLPASLRERPTRVGDVFAMMLRDSSEGALRVVGPPVDVTAEAREVARAAFYSAVATPLDSDEADVLRAPRRPRLPRIEPPAEWLDVPEVTR